MFAIFLSNMLNSTIMLSVQAIYIGCPYGMISSVCLAYYIVHVVYLLCIVAIIGE